MIAALVNEAGQHVSLWRDYLSVLTDPAHLLNEITVTVVIDLLALKVAGGWVRRRFTRRDEEHGHAYPEHNPCAEIPPSPLGPHRWYPVGDGSYAYPRPSRKRKRQLRRERRIARRYQAACLHEKIEMIEREKQDPRQFRLGPELIPLTVAVTDEVLDRAGVRAVMRELERGRVPVTPYAQRYGRSRTEPYPYPGDPA